MDRVQSCWCVWVHRREVVEMVGFGKKRFRKQESRCLMCQ